MQISNAAQAIIDPMKLHGYLLSRTHAVGRFKVPFFEALGYSAEEWRRLDADLRAQHLPQDATPVDATVYGQKYEVRATLVGPANRPARVVSVWIVRRGGDFPRFVTAYPEG